MANDIPFNVKPEEAIDHFRKKGYQVGFGWQDVWHEEHAYNFTVAKAMTNDLLQDIRQAVDNALANGTTLDQFKAELKPTLQAKGWWGKKSMVDPVTGEEKLVQLGSAARLRTIFDTNLRTAYAAGDWEKIQQTKKARPYLRYVAVRDQRTRPQHLAWHDTVLPVDDPWWGTHYPPNGYRCRCGTQQLGPRDLDRYQLKVAPEAPPATERLWKDKRTGAEVRVPEGIDPGFAYNPGKARMRALTPQQLNKPLDVPYMGDPAKQPMPPARKVKAGVLINETKKPEEYVSTFLDQFGTNIGSPVIYQDKAGEGIIISDDLFRTATGVFKIMRDMRYKYMNLLAATIKDPDEIWHVWEEYPAGRWTLRRKYITRFDIEGQSDQTFALFDTNADGWLGVTAFNPEKPGYIERQRKGALVYSRKK